MEITAEGRATTLFIKASSIPGNVYLKFLTADHDLAVGSDPYLHIGVGEAGNISETVVVSIASQLSPVDNRTALSHRSVLRAPGEPLATLRVDIDLDR
jgi:hypothetical protein